jgi:hypothetical protein
MLFHSGCIDMEDSVELTAFDWLKRTSDGPGLKPKKLAKGCRGAKAPR